MIGWDDFPAALGLGDREVVALVGGGGKTTALFALGRHRPGRRVLTTTTKMGVDRTGGLEVLLDPTDEELEAALDQHGRVLVWSATAGARALGVERARCDRWSALADTVVVEADGSRRLPFKAPRAGEPVIPASTTQLVACVGMGAVGVPIGDPMMGLLRDKVSPATARDAVLTGHRYTAAEAIAAGLADAAASEEALVDEAKKRAAELAGKERRIFKTLKRTLYADAAAGLGVNVRKG